MIRPTLYHYLSESSTNYTYRIKLVAEIGSERLDAIETSLAKYRLLDITKPYKMDIRDLPSDFKDIRGIRDVWIVEVELGLPVSAYILQQELRSVLNIPEREIIVRSERDKMELENQRRLLVKDMSIDAKNKGLKPATMFSTHPGYEEFTPVFDHNEEPLYGNEYNKRLLDFLAKVAHGRNTESKKSSTPLFSWLNVPVGTQADDFNKGHDTPKPVPVWKSKGKAVAPSDRVTRHGQVDDSPVVVASKYQNDKGKTTVISKKSPTIGKK